MESSHAPERPLSPENPGEIIRSLSGCSVISTASSFALKHQQARRDDNLQLFRQIGAGSCGVVFEQIGTTRVIKYSTNSFSLAPSVQLWNDLMMHKAINESFDRVASTDIRCEIRIPRCYQYVSQNDIAWWDANIDRFPTAFHHRSHVLISERILPVPHTARVALINLYCPPHLRDTAKLQDGNKDCLIRLYLGKRRDSMPKRLKPLSIF